MSAKQEPPAGVKPLNLSNKQMDTYGLKTGGGRKDTVQHKVFKRDEMLDDAAKFGIYSAWGNVKKDIEAYPEEEMVLVADGPEIYGENWYLLTTVEAKEKYFWDLGAAERAREAEEKAKADEEARIKAEEEALEKLVVKEEPTPARPYASATAAETEREIRSGVLRRTRPPFSVRVQRRRYTFGAKVAFNDRESDALVADFRPRKEPLYDTKLREMDMATQVGTSAFSGKVDAGAQTNWNKPVNYYVQCDADAEVAAATEAGQGAAALFSIDKLAYTPPMSAEEAAAARPPSSVASAAAAPADAAKELLSLPLPAAFRRAAAIPADSVPEDKAALKALIAEQVALASVLESGGAEPSHNRGGGVGAAGGSGGGESHRFGHHGKQHVLSPLERLTQFLQRSLPLCEHALSQNETLNIFVNELTQMASEDTLSLGSGEGVALKEERQFVDLELSQNKALPAIEWHPKAATWLAAAAVPRLRFEQRVAESGSPRVSYVLLYTLGEFVTQLVLEAPADVTCMHWNPTNPSLLAAGCVNGAVCYFDMSDANAAMRKKKKRATAGGGEEGDGSSGGGAGAGSSDSKDGGSEEGGEGGSAGGAEKALRVKAKAVASVEGSHAHGVAFIRWLPMSHHISHRHVFAEEKEEAHACQFLSVAADGVVACWDIRYKEKDKRGRRHDEGAAVPLPLNSTLVPGAANANILAPPQEIPWVPHYKVAIKLGAGAVPITKVVLNDRKPSDPLVCGTDEGHIVAVDWAPAGEGTGTDAWTGSGSGSGGDDDSGGGGGGPGQRLLWSSPDANGRAVHIQRSPFLADTYLVVYDFHFVLWRAGAAAPLYASPAATTPYTAGKWSPTRPAVLFLARADGVVAVWDLLDSSLKPSTTFSLVSIPVTSLEFRVYAGASAAAATGKQLLAAGDSKGSLHILDVPGPLRRGGGNEEALLKGFLDREAVRAGYVAGRVAVREAEKAKKDAAATAAAAAKEAAAQKLDAELKAAAKILEKQDPSRNTPYSVDELEAYRAGVAAAEAEAAYKELAGSIMRELGVREEDITPLEPPQTAGGPAAEGKYAESKLGDTAASAATAKAAAAASLSGTGTPSKRAARATAQEEKKRN